MNAGAPSPLLRADTAGGIPVVTVTGTPHTLGSSVGKRLRSHLEVLVQEAFELVRRDTPEFRGRQGPQQTSAALDRLRQHLQACTTVLRSFDPLLWKELESLAEAARLPVADILLVNGFQDILSAAKSQAPAADGVVAILCPEHAAVGRTVMVAGIYLDPVLLPYLVLVRRMPENSPATVALTLAGLHPFAGLSEAGLAIAGNDLRVNDGSWDALQTGFLLASLLTCPTFEEARNRIPTQARMGGRCLHLLADSGKRASIECTGKNSRMLADPHFDSPRVHTNHLLDDDLAPAATLASDPVSRSRLTHIAGCCRGAREAGFEEILRWFLPDARRVTAWQIPAQPGGHPPPQLAAVLMMDPKLRTVQVQKSNARESGTVTL